MLMDACAPKLQAWATASPVCTPDAPPNQAPMLAKSHRNERTNGSSPRGDIYTKRFFPPNASLTNQSYNAIGRRIAIYKS